MSQQKHVVSCQILIAFAMEIQSWNFPKHIAHMSRYSLSSPINNKISYYIPVNCTNTVIVHQCTCATYWRQLSSARFKKPTYCLQEFNSFFVHQHDLGHGDLIAAMLLSHFRHRNCQQPFLAVWELFQKNEFWLRQPHLSTSPTHTRLLQLVVGYF